MERILIENALIIDPSQHLNEVGDVLIDNGKIIKIGGNLIPDGCKVYDMTGLCLAPGLVDIHVHFRDPGFTHKEDILTGCDSAAAGGFTSVCCMPNTNPTISNKETVEYILNKSKDAKSRVFPIATITNNLNGNILSDYKELKKAGAVGISDDGKPVENPDIMKKALVSAMENDIKIISHCEDLGIINGGIINKGTVSEKLNCKGMDRTSEDTVTAREIMLAEDTNTSIHIAHVSTKGSVQLIREAKTRGVKVTCETAPHYLMFTEQELLKQDADYRMNPPLRTQDDRQAVINGILDGTIDVIATDHAPHTPQEKLDFYKAPNGIVGLETSLGACITILCEKYGMSLKDLIMKMSCLPAQIMNLHTGTLRKGSPADIVIFDPKEKWIVNPHEFKSKSRNSAFKGQELVGKVKYTFLGGKLVYNYDE